MRFPACCQPERMISPATTFLVIVVVFVGTPGIAHAGLVASSTTPNSVTLTWNAPSDGCSGTVSQYDFRYSTSMITEDNWAMAVQIAGEPSPQPAGTKQSLTINDLMPNTAYYFAAKVADGVPNWSSLSCVVVRATSPEAIPPAAVGNLATYSSGPGSIGLTWTAPGDDGNVGIAAAYDIRYSVSAITSGNFASATGATGIPAPKAAGNIENFVVAGLIEGTIYYFAIKTVDDASNWSALSNVVSGTTTGDEMPPAAITDLTAI